MNSRKTPSQPSQPSPESRPSATILAIPQAGTRRFRRDTSSDAGPAGQILLFTGVRYERMPDFEAEPAVRQRKRS